VVRNVYCHVTADRRVWDSHSFAPSRCFRVSSDWRPLAEQTEIPRRDLAKVLQGLVRAGLINCVLGPAKGYSIVRPAEAITSLDVVNAVTPME
jgi:DNA-binding IscR family transcriptional regulator